MQCTFETSPNDPRRKKCSRWRCGRVVFTADPPERIHAECRRPGLGDRVARLLEAIGVYKRRVGCGCKRRQGWLNRVGAMVGF